MAVEAQRAHDITVRFRIPLLIVLPRPLNHPLYPDHDLLAIPPHIPHITTPSGNRRDFRQISHQFCRFPLRECGRLSLS